MLGFLNDFSNLFCFVVHVLAVVQRAIKGNKAEKGVV